MSEIQGKAPQLVPVQFMALIYGKHTNVNALLLAEKLLNKDFLRAAGVKVGEFEQSTGLQQTAIGPPRKVLTISHNNLNDFELMKQIVGFVGSAPAYELEFEMFHRFPASTSQYERWHSPKAGRFLRLTYDFQNTLPADNFQPAHLV